MTILPLELVQVSLLLGFSSNRDFMVPEAPAAAEAYMPESVHTFWQDLLYVLKSAVQELNPSITEAARLCLCIIAIILLVTIMQSFSGISKNVINLVGAVAVGTLLLQPTGSLIELGVKTVKDLTDYGKLLFPVMTAALAAEGGVSTSAALYAGTAVLVTVLSAAVSSLLVPLLYIFLCLCISCSAIGENILKQLRDFMKWLITWGMKIILYVFTGYMSITGVISGTADAAAVKATKLTISGAVPVVGNILSDASETILVSAGLMKNSAGVYGLIVLAALLIGPFVRIGVHYLLLMITAAICGVFSEKNISSLIEDFSAGMGFTLAMTGITSLLLMVSVVCFMKGVS